AGLAVFYERIPVGHVEAGLRTGDIYAPWPEEMNRKLTGAIADLHFAPTPAGKSNLLREGVPVDKVVVTGNTVIDALLDVGQRIRADVGLRARLAARLPVLGSGRRLILGTGRRRDNCGRPFARLCRALAALARRDDVQSVYPVHMNPGVQEPVHRIRGRFSEEAVA